MQQVTEVEGAFIQASSQPPVRDTGLDGSIFSSQRGVNLHSGRNPVTEHMITACSGDEAHTENIIVYLMEYLQYKQYESTCMFRNMRNRNKITTNILIDGCKESKITTWKMSFFCSTVIRAITYYY